MNALLFTQLWTGFSFRVFTLSFHDRGFRESLLGLRDDGGRGRDDDDGVGFQILTPDKSTSNDVSK